MRAFLEKTAPLNNARKITNLYQTIIANSINGGLCGVMPYFWGPPGPNAMRGSGSFCTCTDDTSVCELLRNMAP